MQASSRPPLNQRSAFITAAVVLSMMCFQPGCVATKYKLAKKNTPPIQLLNVHFPTSPPLQTTLASLIIYKGAGSWKREALWDEYVITIENQGDQPLTIDSATLVDSEGVPFAAGSDPWVLEKQSKKLEKQYRDHGEAFFRAAGPGVLIAGVGAATVSAAAGGSAVFIAPAVAGAAVVTVVALPVYYLSVLGINHHNKKAVMTEFRRRRLPLPSLLAPGETRTGSLFYPMIRSPGSLSLRWSSESSGAAAVLPLDVFHSLHVPDAPREHVAQ
jgi:hypothetical protein